MIISTDTSTDCDCNINVEEAPWCRGRAQDNRPKGRRFESIPYTIHKNGISYNIGNLNNFVAAMTGIGKFTSLADVGVMLAWPPTCCGINSLNISIN